MRVLPDPSTDWVMVTEIRDWKDWAEVAKAAVEKAGRSIASTKAKAMR